MFTLLIIILFGIFFSIVATQNTVNVPVNLLNQQFNDVPLYLVILISLLIGVALSWGLNLANRVSTIFILSKKDIDLKHSRKEITKLQTQLHKVETENLLQRRDKTSLEKDYPNPSFLDRIRNKKI